jgi:hypothetical protein
MHVGIEALFVVIRSSDEFYYKPHFFTTCEPFEQYLAVITSLRGWSTLRLVSKLESFALANCDVAHSCLPVSLYFSH